MKTIDRNKEEGFILVTAIVWIVVCGVLASTLMFMARTSINSTAPKAKSETAFLLAQSALLKAKRDIKVNFTNYYDNGPDAKTAMALDWFTEINPSLGNLGKSGYVYRFPINAHLPGPTDESAEFLGSRSGDILDGTYSVKVAIKQIGKETTLSNGKQYSKAYLVKITVDAQVDNRKRCVEEVVVYGINKMPFTYALFAERGPDLSDSRVDVNGDIFFNDNWDSSKYPTTLNGDLYTIADISSAPKYLSLDNYIRKAPSSAAPADTATNPQEYGYDGSPELFPNQEPVDLPRISNFQEYINLGSGMTKPSGAPWSLKAQDLALDHNNPGGAPKPSLEGVGSGVDNGLIPLDGVVYTGNGPDGIKGTPDDGSLVLDGTLSPIEINGPVVVTGDLVIRGTITGEGTFFVGGNIHILDDVGYHEALDNPKTGYTETQLTEHNKERDLVGFVAA
ncbi:MAG: hypothetical protein KAG98_04965, partial [Lentisphaeria bacterium]|nr:hypothetical protein [Lentisphaeria bacterium]